MGFSQEDSESEPEKIPESHMAAYELIYHIDASKEPSLSVFEENGQQKIAFYVPLSPDMTSRDEAQRLADAPAAKIFSKMEGCH